MWVVLWGLLGWVALLGANRSPQGLHQLVSQMATGQPRWLAGLDHHVANLLAHRGLGFSVGLAAILGIIAVGVFLPAGLARVTVVLALVLGAGIWVLGENFGGIFTGSGTDPNSGPLLMLIAAAYWPYRAGPRRRRSPRTRSSGGVGDARAWVGSRILCGTDDRSFDLLLCPAARRHGRCGAESMSTSTSPT